jgi:hypothetical protein
VSQFVFWDTERIRLFYFPQQSGRRHRYLSSKRCAAGNGSPLEKILTETRHHQVCQALIVAFDVTVVGEIGDDDQSQGFGIGSETLKGVDLATKLDPFLSAFDPVPFVQLTNDMEHFLAAQAIEIGLISYK